ncbi:MAG TPA: urea ABC transporter ATP-binding subunit UrtE [Tepidisphaeraceae bacterium]|jgi:urea transport system ATP-binding protein|nr:urea ABC transporter ATP-binding subunit UrtE [Tepidisphaeraceae bacterium]
MLNVKDLTVAYGESEIIRDMSFSMPRGETLAIMGRNGMGKTTLMKALIGILRNKTGSIKVGDKDLTTLDSFKRVGCGLGYVPQGRQIFSTLTVEENLKTGLSSIDKTKIDDHIYHLFPVLKEMRRRRGGNLSGGQQQQLAIARALISEPTVLMLDEPTEGIQPSIVKEIGRALNEIKKLRNLTILVSEQVLSFTLDIADRILVMEGGRFVHEDMRANVDEAKISRYLSI